MFLLLVVVVAGVYIVELLTSWFISGSRQQLDDDTHTDSGASQGDSQVLYMAMFTISSHQGAFQRNRCIYE